MSQVSVRLEPADMRALSRLAKLARRRRADYLREVLLDHLRAQGITPVEDPHE